MKERIIIIVGLLFFSFFIMSCNEKPKEPLKEPDCRQPLMCQSSYEIGVDTTKPEIKYLKKGFSIVIDSNYKAYNYIARSEEYAINQSKRIDTTGRYYFYEGWKKLSEKQKMEKIIEERNNWRNEITIRHKSYNDGKQIVWLINNSIDTVVLQTTLFKFYCVLQAKNIYKEWKSIETAPFVFDNFQQVFTEILPNRAFFFKATLPDTGSYQTTLRFALLGLDSIYYSNEFKGKINYCQFKISKHYNDLYKLDTFARMVSWKYKNK